MVWQGLGRVLLFTTHIGGTGTVLKAHWNLDELYVRTLLKYLGYWQRHIYTVYILGGKKWDASNGREHTQVPHCFRAQLLKFSKLPGGIIHCTCMYFLSSSENTILSPETYLAEKKHLFTRR
jgi:hypothetical protein